jgi:hypothetical protein
MGYGIYPKTPIFYVKIGMILVRLRAKKMDAVLYSLRFIRSGSGSLAVWKGIGGFVV